LCPPSDPYFSILVLFLPQWFLAHRALPSFPTRRSSDLGLVTGGLDFSNLYINLSGEEYASLAAAQEAGAPTINYGMFINNIVSRSEEHTSELQSRENLVCRLLLEKKKTITSSPNNTRL